MEGVVHTPVRFRVEAVDFALHATNKTDLMCNILMFR